MDVMGLRRGLLMQMRSGGGRDYSMEAAIIGRTLETYENPFVEIAGYYAFYRCSDLESVSLPNCTGIKDSAFRYCSALKSVYLPKLSNVASAQGNYFFGNCTSLQTIALPSVTTGTGNGLALTFYQDTALTTVDIGNHEGTFTNQTFGGCTNFNKLILRRADAPWGLANVNVFNGTKFADGGAGGTIYIPKALYDHLGDGTQYDYKAATNWTTINNYGTITWAKIEGSAYENTYADGTSV